MLCMEQWKPWFVFLWDTLGRNCEVLLTNDSHRKNWRRESGRLHKRREVSLSWNLAAVAVLRRLNYTSGRGRINNRTRRLTKPLKINTSRSYHSRCPHLTLPNQLQSCCAWLIAERHLCVQLSEPSPCSSAEGYYLRAKIIVQTLSLPNTFFHHSMRQWCMKNGLHIWRRPSSVITSGCSVF